MKRFEITVFLLKGRVWAICQGELCSVFGNGIDETTTTEWSVCRHTRSRLLPHGFSYNGGLGRMAEECERGHAKTN